MQTQKIYKPTEKIPGSYPAPMKDDLDEELGSSKEIAMLLSMGVERYEIQYLLHLKKKEQVRRKWDNHGKNKDFI